MGTVLAGFLGAREQLLRRGRARRGTTQGDLGAGWTVKELHVGGGGDGSAARLRVWEGGGREEEREEERVVGRERRSSGGWEQNGKKEGGERYVDMYVKVEGVRARHKLCEHILARYCAVCFEFLRNVMSLVRHQFVAVAAWGTPV